MNKSQMVESIATEANLTRTETRKVLDALINTTVKTLRNGEKVTLSGLGTFSVIHKSARTGRNPRTGMPVKIAAKKSIKFRASADIEVSENYDQQIV